MAEDKKQYDPEAVKQFLELTKAIAGTIRSLKVVPSGLLYAQCMGYVRLDQYMNILTILKRAGEIEVTPSHLVRWIGK